MTKDHDFKQLVRERMAKTGESYAAARRQLRLDLDVGETTTTTGYDRKLLIVRAAGNVDIAGCSAFDALESFDAGERVGAQFAKDRLERRRIAAREGLWPGPAVDLGVEAVGGHGIDEVEVDGDTVVLRGSGHLGLQLVQPYDLRVETNGHVFVDQGEGDVDVQTEEGHVRRGCPGSRGS